MKIALVIRSLHLLKLALLLTAVAILGALYYKYFQGSSSTVTASKSSNVSTSPSPTPVSSTTTSKPVKTFEFQYDNARQIYADDFSKGFANWYHEGIDAIESAPSGGMRLHCFGGNQGGKGCMAFLRPNLPDKIVVEYGIAVRSQGGW